MQFLTSRHATLLSSLGSSVAWQEIQLASVVQTLDSTIQRIKIYLVDNAIGFPNTYPLDSDLSGGSKSTV